MTKARPILQPIKGNVSLGRKGKDRPFDMVGVFPARPNGIVAIAFQCDGGNAYVELSKDEAIKLAREILSKTADAEIVEALDGYWSMR